MAVAGDWSADWPANDSPTPPRPKHVFALAAPSDTQHLSKLLRRMNPAIDRDGVGDVSIGGRTWTIRREMLDDFDEWNLPDRVATLVCPATILHGPDDTTVGFDHALRLAGLIRGGGQSASVISLENTDHLLTRGFSPEGSRGVDPAATVRTPLTLLPVHWMSRC